MKTADIGSSAIAIYGAGTFKFSGASDKFDRNFVKNLQEYNLPVFYTNEK